MITKEEACIVKFFSLIFIIFAHFYGWIAKDSVIAATKFGASISQCGVSLFLLLSGYGLYKSYQRNALQKFWYKRFTRIYISFLLVIIPQFLLEVWKYHENIRDMYIVSTCLSALGVYPNNIIDGTMWFIPFIMLQYFVFWCTFRFQSHMRIMLVGEALIYLIFKKCFIWVNENDIYAIVFMLGVLYAVNEIKMEWIYNKFTGYISLFIYIITLAFYDAAIIRMINCLSLMSLMLCIVHAVYNGRCKRILNKILILGNISYELYLTEAIFFFNPIIYDWIGYNYLGLLVHILSILILAIVINKLSIKIQLILDGRFDNDRSL